MNVQFGRWNFDGSPVGNADISKVRELLTPYGPDGQSEYCGPEIRILNFSFCTMKETCGKAQLVTLPSGAVLSWDGRLDNRSDLVRELGGRFGSESPDVEIVAGTYERWSTSAFAKLVGDWALSLWDPSSQSLLLARDFMGMRPLYYASNEKFLVWSSILDPLVQVFSEGPLQLERAYIAGYLLSAPAAHLTPFENIRAVPPSNYVLLRSGGIHQRKYWDFDAKRQIRYCGDAAYEEHFLSLFTEAVSRRMRSGWPVLGELSGGMDSSSIVCAADVAIRLGKAPPQELDTVSYFTETEPHWNEKPFFERVELFRGRTGCHIDVGYPEPFTFRSAPDRFPATPACRKRRHKSAEEFARHVRSRGYRVLLSGFGGDEMTGGVPTPLPELWDLLAGLRFFRLACRLKVWAMEKRKPWMHLLFETCHAFLPGAFTGSSPSLAPEWFNSNFAKPAYNGRRSRIRLFGSRPSFQDSLDTLESLRRQIALLAPPNDPRYETRYPFFDRDLLEFLFAIPREQLVRPGQRRSLMRRALAGIVPEEILNRKRKAFVFRALIAALSFEPETSAQLTDGMLSASLGCIDPQIFFQAIDRARLGLDCNTRAILRTLSLEAWLRRLRDLHILSCEPVSSAEPFPTKSRLRFSPSVEANP